MVAPAGVLLAVTVGGAIGSALRYLAVTRIHASIETHFPVGTLVVNLVGCLAIGLLLRLVLDLEGVSVPTRALLSTGLLGGFTTFSTFAWETLELLEQGALGRAVGYVLTSVTIGVAGVWLGTRIARLTVSLLRSSVG